jgi:prepilin-type N-terminal cleavage/methylation domain-containing protein
METYPWFITNRNSRESGFSMIEVVFAIGILAVGLSALAMLAAQTMSGTERARYLSLATMLVSEKLEDLNRWPSVDPHVAAGGSLTTDSASGSINYYDDIDFSNTTGQVSETVASTSGGVTTYTNVIHQSTGYVNTTATTTAPAGSGIISFHRRWLIEANPTVNSLALTGSRRITVEVTLSGGAVRPGAAASFQQSLVRP